MSGSWEARSHESDNHNGYYLPHVGDDNMDKQ